MPTARHRFVALVVGLFSDEVKFLEGLHFALAE
jgi:hypothetical protein